jgi:hypothetical protein
MLQNELNSPLPGVTPQAVMAEGESWPNKPSSYMLKFLNDPVNFNGNIMDVNPKIWIEKLQRIKDLAGLNNKEIILIASDHLMGTASTLFEVTFKSLDNLTWEIFKKSFLNKYYKNQEDLWWAQISRMKQRTNESAEDLAIRVRQLYDLIGIDNDKIMKRTYLDALHKDIAWEVESSNCEEDTFDEVIKKGSLAEDVIRRFETRGYRRQYQQPMPTYNSPNNINSNNNSNANNNKKTLTCFNCGKEGHIKPNCPELEKSKDKEKPVQAVNTIKHQVYNVTNKRPRPTTITEQRGSLPVVGERPRRKRAPLRYLTVRTKKHDVWSKLLETNAGLSISDWLAMDKDAIKDVVDGIRYLKSRNRTRIGFPPDTLQTITTEPMVTNVNTQEVTGDSDYDSEDSMDLVDLYSSDEEGEYDSDTLSETEAYEFSMKTLGKDSPLTGCAEINNVLVPYCIFDTGASVSVLSQQLAETLNIKADTEDMVKISSFDNGSRQKCGIATNVDVVISGHSRPNHFCIQPTPGKPKKFAIFGMPWLKAYGITIDPQNGILNIPTKSEGVVKLNCSTTYTEKQFKEKQLEPEVFAVYVKKNSQANDRPDWENFLVATLHGDYVSDSEDDEEKPYEGYYDELEGLEAFGIDAVCKVVKDIMRSDEPVETSRTIQTEPNNTTPTPIIENTNNKVKDLSTYSDEILLSDNVTVIDTEEFSHVGNSAIRGTLKTYKDAFVEVSGLGNFDLVKHSIQLNKPDSTPIRTKPFRLSWAEEDHLTTELKNMLDLGIIRPSDGTWCSPCFFVKKHNGKLRLVIDYRKLNTITIKNGFALPIIDTLLDKLGNNKCFSVIDMAQGFWQVPLEENSKKYTGFVTHKGCYEFNVMPFGLANSPSTYQYAMTKMLEEYIGDFIYVFIDDVIIFSKNLEEHVEHCRKVLEKCKKHNMKINLTKSKFLQTTVEYLGHEISANGIFPHSRNTEKVKNFPPIKNADMARSFLGLSGYYRKFIPNYAAVAEPLVRLTRKKQPFIWGTEQIKAYEQLKDALVKPPILSYPLREFKQILTVDGSNLAVAAILSQSKDGTSERETVISYASKTLGPAQKNYAQVHLEAYAVVWAVDHFSHYLKGRHFILRTDCSAVAFIMKPSTPSPKLARWSATMMEYDYTIEHIPGKNNPSDSLSRLIPETQK